MKARHRAAIALLVVAVIIALIVGRWLRPYDLKSERIAARAVGIPLSEGDFRQPTPSPNEDATPIYAKLHGILGDRHVGFGGFGWYGRQRGPGTARLETADLRTLVNRDPEVSRLVHLAASRPHASREAAQSSSRFPPELMAMQAAAEHINNESDLLARDGRFEDAVRNEALALVIANHAAEQTSLMGLRVSAFVEVAAMREFADILERAGDKRGVAVSVSRELAKYRSLRDITRCLQSEALRGLSAIHQVGPDGMLPPGSLRGPYAWNLPATPQHKPGVLKRSLYVSASEAVYLHWMTEFVAVSQLPEQKRAEAASAIERKFKAATDTNLIRPQTTPGYTLVGTLSPAFSRACKREIDAEYTRVVVSTAASVLAYRARIGRYPTSVKQAVSPEPLDPRTGHPIQYWPTETGFVLRDAAGSPDSGERGPSPIQFQYPMPASGDPGVLGSDQPDLAAPAGRRERRAFGSFNG